MISFSHGEAPFNAPVLSVSGFSSAPALWQGVRNGREYLAGAACCNPVQMWFDPGSLCWHCVLVKGETGKEGILVDAEGYSYARYAASAPDCDRLRLQDIPVHYEHPARVPEQKKTRKRKEPER